MKTLTQFPTDPEFVQNPYPFYNRIRAAGDIVFWQDYDMPVVVGHGLTSAIFRDRRFGREVPQENHRPVPDHLRAFYDIEAHSMLELEAPRHTRLRSLVLRAFTSRRIKELAPEIEALSHALIDQFPDQEFDLLSAFADPLPVTIIARLLGVPEDMGPQLLKWSHAMVAMYQASRTRATEEAAAQASSEFDAFIRSYIEIRRMDPGDDLLTHLIAAEEDGEKLSTDELVTTCILLLNAGHEATVHSIGNGVKTLLEHNVTPDAFAPDAIDRTVEETLRFDPPLHMFTRHAYEDIEIGGHKFQRGDEVALLLGAANRDPAIWETPDIFDVTRAIKTNTSFGGGAHFCVGAPLARLELKIALPILFERCPKLRITEPPRYGNVYHFHGLERLGVTR